MRIEGAFLAIAIRLESAFGSQTVARIPCRSSAPHHALIDTLPELSASVVVLKIFTPTLASWLLMHVALYGNSFNPLFIKRNNLL